jgi:hypothetical protein
MFRTRETRPGPGALCTPGTAVPARPRMNPVAAACRLATAGPCHPGTAAHPGMFSSRGISKGSLTFTHPGHSPRLWPPDGTGALGLFPGLHTRLSRTQPRMPGRGRASGTGPGSRRRHQRPPSTDPLNTSGLMSQFTWKVPSARRWTGLSTSPILPGQRRFLHLYRHPRLTPGESPRLADQGVVACQACALVEPAGGAAIGASVRRGRAVSAGRALRRAGGGPRGRLAG